MLNSPGTAPSNFPVPPGHVLGNHDCSATSRVPRYLQQIAENNETTNVNRQNANKSATYSCKITQINLQLV